MQRDCDACQGIEPLTPQTVANRPGLPALRYRVGTHGSFLDSMIARLSTFGADKAREQAERNSDRRPGQLALPPSTWLRTREPADPTIAMLDAWATVGDILTFYQERIANEGYLSTALERRSLHELANLVGYKLRPALSSSVYLAFDVQPPPAIDREVPPAPPHEVLIPKGTQARHIPGPGEQPQVFETMEDLVGRPEWNQLKPRMTKPNVTDVGTAYETDIVYVEGTEGRLKPGEFVAFSFPDATDVQFGPHIRPETVLRQVFAVTPEAAAKRTRIDLVRSQLSLRAFKKDLQYYIALFQATLNANSPLPTISNTIQSFTNPIAALKTKVTNAASMVKLDSIISKWLNEFDENDNNNPSTSAYEYWNPSVIGYAQAKTQVLAIRDTLLGDATTFKHIVDAQWTQKLTGLESSLQSMKRYVDRLRVEVSNMNAAMADPDAILKSSLNPASIGGLADLASKLDSDELKNLADQLNNHLAGIVDRPMVLNLAMSAISKAVSVDLGAASLDEMISKASDYLQSASITCSSLIGQLPVVQVSGSDPDWDDLSLRAKEIIDDYTNEVLWKGNKTGPLATALSKDAAAVVVKVRKSAIDGIENAGTKWIASLGEVGVPPQVITPGVDKSDISGVTDEIKKLWPSTYEEVINQTKQIVLKSDSQLHPGVSPFSLLISADKVASVEQARSVLVDSLHKASVPALNVLVATLEEFKRMRTEPVVTEIEAQVTELKKLETWSASTSQGCSSRLKMARDFIEKLEATKDPPTIALAKALIRRLNPPDSIEPSIDPNEVPSVGSLESVTGIFGQRPNGLGTDGGNGIEARFNQNSDLIVQILENFQPELRGQLRREWLRREFRPNVQMTVFRSRAGLFGGGAKGIDTPAEKVFHSITQKDGIDNGETTKNLFLEGDIQGIKPGGMVLVGVNPSSASNVGLSFGLTPFLVRDAQSIERSAYALTGKSTRIDLDEDWRSFFPESVQNRDATFVDLLRCTLVWCASEELTLVEGPYEEGFPEIMPGNTESRSSFLLSTTIDGLKTGQYLMFAGDYFREGEPAKVANDAAESPQFTRVVRIVAVENVSDEGKLLTKVTVSPAFHINPAPNSPSEKLKRSTVRIYANVVEATNGASVEEVIGNGEGQGAFQKFLLSQPKLTYLPADNETGMKPELEVRVNSVAWNQAQNVGELQPALVPGQVVSGTPQRMGLPRKYLTSVDDDQNTFLTTGDGKTTGERLPTGITNVRATYRVGGGKGGNVKEGTITQLASPPLNVTKVRNVMPASGGVDRENVDQARKNLPVAVMSLDRLVSVADYESFARKFAGIAKAQATVLRLSGRNTVVVTIAALDDQTIDKQSLLYKNLEKALKKYADPEQEVIVEPRELMLLMTKAKINVEDGYSFADVKEWVRTRILQRFDFEKARLGESVLLSDLIETIQNTRGVRYVDVDMFDRMRQFYGTGDMVRKAACIAEAKVPKQRITCMIARERDADTDTVLVVPKEVTAGEFEKLEKLVAAISGYQPDPQTGATSAPDAASQEKPDTHIESAVLLDGKTLSPINKDTEVNQPTIVTLRIFKNDYGNRRPPKVQDNLPAPFPAQLAYFTDLAGTILLEEIL